ncbi:hypothetical protein GCM10027048_24230 [Hymenobacter coalescens]
MSLSFTLRHVAALCGFLLSFLLASCSEKGSDDPAPATGQVRGVLTPLGATSRLQLTLATGTEYTAQPDPATGAFAFSGLPAGDYTLTATPTTGFNPTTPVPLTVYANQTTTKNLQMTRDGRIRGTMSWTLNGVTHQATALFYGQILDNLFSLEGSSPADASGAFHAVTLVVPQLVRAPGVSFQGVGTYPLGVAEYPFGMVNAYPRAGAGYDRHITSYAGRRLGQVVITHFDLTTRTARGTFEFEAQLVTNNSGNAPSTVAVTNGRFDVTF